MIKAHAKGQCAELMFLAFLAKHNISFAIPFGNQESWDCIIKHENGWKQYQVKTVYKYPRKNTHSKSIEMSVSCQRNLSPRTGLKRKHKQYKADDFDFLIAVDVERNKFWKIPATITITHKKLIVLHDNDDYVWE